MGAQRREQGQGGELPAAPPRPLAAVSPSSGPRQVSEFCVEDKAEMKRKEPLHEAERTPWTGY